MIRQRSAVAFSVDSAEVARLVCADVAGLGEYLRAIGVDGDGLVWLHGWGTLPGGSLTALVTAGAAAGLPVLVTTTSPAAAVDFAGLMNVVVVHRLADADAAAGLAGRTGTRLVPSALEAERVASASLVPAMASGAATGSGTALTAPGPAVPLSPGGLVPRPAVPPHALLSLGPGEFVLAVDSPRHRLVELGRAVRARLPREAGP